MRKVALLLLSLLVALAFAACDDHDAEYRETLYEATRGLDDAVRGHGFGDDGKNDWDRAREDLLGE